MKIGIIGAGRVGCSMGRYLAEHQAGEPVFYDRHPERAAEAAEFCARDEREVSRGELHRRPSGSCGLGELIRISDMIWITTPDDEIARVWDDIGAVPLTDKTICHFSGSLSSAVFQGIEATGAAGCSIHPMLAFSDKYSSYARLENAFFTIEGDPRAVLAMRGLLEPLGNEIVEIDASKKRLYHCAASVLSNQVVAVLASGFSMLEQAGFPRSCVQEAVAALIRGNVENVLAAGPEAALTGPVERGDVETVAGHLACVPEGEKEMYLLLAKKLLAIARRKNPERDYERMEALLLDNMK